MRLAIVATQPHIRAALVFLLEQQPDITVLCALGPTSNPVLRLVTLHPDVTLLDWELPGRLAQRILVALRRSPGHGRIVVLSAQEQAEAQARAAGADAFVSRDEPPAELIRALRAAHDARRLTVR